MRIAHTPAVAGSLLLPLSTRTTLSGALFAAVAACAFASAIFPDPIWTTAFFVLELILIIAPATACLYRRQLDPFEPIHVFLFGTLVFFWISPLYSILYGTLTTAGALSAMRLTCLCIGVFVLVYWMPRSARAKPRFRCGEPVDLYLRLFIVAAIGLAGWVGLLRAYGGFDQLLLSERASQVVTADSVRIYTAMRLLLTPVVTLLLALTIGGRIKSIAARFFVLLAGATYAYLLYRVGGSRINTFEVIFAILAQYHYLVKPISLKRLALIVPLLFTLSATMMVYRSFFHLGSYRQTTELERLFSSTDAFADRTLGSWDYAMFDNTIMVMDFFPTAHDYLWGDSYLKILYTPIPRWLWPDKPMTTSRVATQLMFSYRQYASGTSVGVSMVGEGYIYFGFAGAILAAALVALILRAIYATFIEHVRTVGSVGVYSVGLFALVFDILRGILQSALIHYGIVTVGALLICWTSMPRGRSIGSIAPKSHSKGSSEFT